MGTNGASEIRIRTLTEFLNPTGRIELGGVAALRLLEMQHTI